jgi:tRNA G10  N-methylase Trm11
MQHVYILGRQAAIGRAELESLFGNRVQAIEEYAALVEAPSLDIPFSRIGSSIKAGEVLGVINSTDWPKVQRDALRLGLARARDLSEGKIQLGLSAYGLNVNPRQLGAAGLTLKKQLRNAGYSVRLVPNQEKENALSSAQVLHNHLTGERGLELLLIRSGTQTIVARTSHVQDITAYAHRDQNRPKRDARVGMLPPKLAQTIINLAAAQTQPEHGRLILDPFCGTGVLLQEAQLMGFDTYGTDLEPRMIDYTNKNLEWLHDTHNPASTYFKTEVGDATEHTWQPTEPIAAVATEAYLGRPLAQWPEPPVLQDIVMACNTIIEKFLRNIHSQLAAHTRLCIAIPAWISPNGRIKHLPLLDRLEDLGYNRLSFAIADDVDLVYHREGQIVGRELLVITRK